MNKKGLFLGIMAKVLVMFIVLGSVCSCASTPNSTIPPNVNFSNYRYAYITGLHLSHVTAGSLVDLKNTLLLSGYNVITEDRIASLNDNEKSKIMLVDAGVVLTNKINCTIIITDYLKGDLLASFIRTGISWWGNGSVIKYMGEAIRDMEKVIKKIP